VWVAIVVVMSAGLAAHFAVDFVGARAWYGLAAAVHAWVEWPVLVVGLARSTRETPPAPAEARGIPAARPPHP
jgi:hypothetical protein